MGKSIFGGMSPIIVTWMLLLLLVAGYASQASAIDCQPASSGRLQNIHGVYNSTIPASMFRNDTDKLYFKVWPEDITNPRFRFFCQDGMSGLLLSNFTATCDQRVGQLDPRPYYDVGTADSLRPYYKHWRYSEIIATTDIQIHCERDDMRRLYSRRIRTKVLIPALITTIVLLIILEFAVILCGFLWRYRNMNYKTLQPTQTGWFPNLGTQDTIADCIHILLLVAGGFCMIEAVSHSSTRSWRSTCMLDAAVIYTYLTFFAVISSFLRQVATACRAPTKDQGSASQTARPTTSPTAKNQDPEVYNLEKEGNDWRWQRVFNQFAVVILVTAFLSYNENFAGDALDDLVSVIWSVIMVAATWSIGVSIVIGCRAVVVMVALANQRWPSKDNKTRHPSAAP